jgi:uncharacterized membrane protein YeaQ/YmgE (transglycosylase-associated protein family)
MAPLDELLGHHQTQAACHARQHNAPRRGRCHARSCFFSTTPDHPGTFGTSIATQAEEKAKSFGKGATMTVLDFVILLVVAGICGALGQAIAGFSRGGCLASIALGFIGALLGAWIARGLNLPEPFQLVIGDQPFPIIWSIVGSALFVAVISLISRRSTSV